MATAATSPRHRAIVLVDMDCFYVQVEQRLAPDWNGKPCAVAQYNTFQGGGLIAVNYEARAFGVKRGMRGQQAEKLAKGLHLFRVPEVRGKADLTRYREAGAEVLSVLCQFSDVVERASIDEAYLDLTETCKTVPIPSNVDALPNTYLGQRPKVTASQDGTDPKAELAAWLSEIEDPDCPDALLARAAALTEQIRAAVFTQTGFRCSAGIAHNKVLAKLACGLNKPNKQTVLTETGVPILFSTLPVHKLRKLGGKLGQDIQELLQVEVVADVLRFSQDQLASHFGQKTGTWLYHLVRGVDHELVTPRKLAQSIGCGKNFRGKLALDTTSKVKHWLEQLCEELVERLLRDREQNQRTAQLLVVSVRKVGQEGGTSRSCQLVSYDSSRVAKDALAVVMKLKASSPASSDTWNPPLINLSIAATKFRDSLEDGSQEISKFLVRQSKSATPKKPESAPPPPTAPKTAEETSEAVSENKISASHSLDTPKKEDQREDLPFSEKLAMILASPRKPSKDDSVVPSTVAKQSHVEEVKRALSASTTSASSKKTSKATGAAALKPKKTTSKKSSKKATPVDAPKVSYFEKMWARSEAGEKASPSTDGTAKTENWTSNICAEGIDDALSVQCTDSLSCDGLPGSTLVLDEDDGKAVSSRLSHVEQRPSVHTENTDIAERAGTTPALDDGAGVVDGNSDEGGWKYLSIDPSLLHKCKQCGKTVLVWKKEEHDDYHVALNLSRENCTVTTVAKPVPVNRKRAASTSTKKVTREKKACAEKTKTLKDFFT
ncbi:hypothetical protein V5799_004897 [Amblyomma americanum]|uniref:DNA polymerase eta n=1 Tax=Amblyomma americanum TaxID=6943 RepID=A0AAQ4D4U0_AMBAM